MIIGIIIIKTEYSNFRKSHIKNFRNTLIEEKCFVIKTSWESKSDIDFEEISILK